MDIKELKREFRYNGVKLAEPTAEFSLVQVRDFYATVYPEIISADIEGPEQVGAIQIYTFRRAVGTKGAGLLDEQDMADVVADLQVPATASWMLPGDRQFVADVADTLQRPGVAAITLNVQRRLVDLHVGYCIAEAA